MIAWFGLVEHLNNDEAFMHQFCLNTTTLLCGVAIRARRCVLLSLVMV